MNLLVMQITWSIFLVFIANMTETKWNIFSNRSEYHALYIIILSDKKFSVIPSG